MIQLYTRNGAAVPPVGLGTFPFQGREMADIVKRALKVGYKLIDTADDYRGEFGIGIAVSELDEVGLKREDVFLQTKVTDDDSFANEPLTGIYFNKNSKYMMRHSVEDVVREKVSKSLYEMRTDYLDSLLIHQPYPSYMVDIWKVMIKLKEEGVVRYIGVSNFHERHIEMLINETGVCPSINEIYTSPIGSKQQLVDYCNQHSCVINTYSPLMDLAQGHIDADEIAPIARKYGKSIAQIILRWNIERGCMPLPKSKNPKRLVENFSVMDFVLTDDDMSELSRMNKDYQHLVESLICPGL